MNESDLPVRVALVTGAARGIGAETVRTLCRQGYKVIAIDSCAESGVGRPEGVAYPLSSPDDLERLRLDFPDQILTRIADVRDRGALEQAAADGVAAFGRLDAVVAAAAVIVGGKPLWETPDSYFDTLWDVDVRGVWNTAAACVPHILNGPDPSGGRFVAIASAAASHGLFHLAGYNAAKHAVVGLVKGLAADLVGTGTTAVAVSPGSTRTPMLVATAQIYELGDVEEFASSQLIRRLITPAEIAATIAFCCSVEGAVLNGSVVSADGGFGV